MSEPLVTVFSGGGTGGHLYPALAIAAALVERRPDVTPFFVGAQRGLESRVLPQRGLEHLLVPVEGVKRGAVLANLRVARLLVLALGQVASVFHRIRPRLVVVTGGYAGGPAGLVAVLTRTRLVLQEQNSFPGITTRLLSLFAREVHVAFPEAVDALPRRARGKARVSGNPVRPPTPHDRTEAARSLGLDPEARIVLVVGGSQGSQALNQGVREFVNLVESGARERPKRLQLLWATGPAHFESLSSQMKGLGNPAWVRLVGYIEEMPLALSVAELAVSRAGAMATSEFLAWGLPAVLVPLPTAAADHQTRNATVLAHAGAALHLSQEEASGEVLWESVDGLLRGPDTLAAMADAALSRGRPGAAADIARSLDRLLPPPPSATSGSPATDGRGEDR